MTRLVRFIACAAFTLLLQLGIGGQQASAQTYNFNFNGGTFGIFSGTFQITGTTITSVSGTVSGSMDGNGSLSLGAAAGTFDPLFPSRAVTYTLLSTTAKPYLPDGANSELELVAGGTTYRLYSSGANYGVADYVNTAQLMSAANESLQATPAPIPGAGTLSWLALGLGIVIVRRKGISATLRSAYSRIAGRASA